MDNKKDLLSKEESLDLEKELRLSNFTSVIVYLVLFLLMHLLIYAKTNRWTIPNLEILLIIGLLIVTYFLSKYFTRELRREIQDGYKTIEFKPIENKYDFMDKQDRFSLELKKYVIVAKGKKYVVTEEEYKKAEISDYLAVHLTPLREKSIKIEILKQEYHLPLTAPSL
jgi:hypothetical protein